MDGTLHILLAVLIVGALLLAVGSFLPVRSTRSERVDTVLPTEWTTEKAEPLWPRAATDSNEPLDVPMRLDLVARLAIINEPWCRTILQDAQTEEPDPTVRSAITAALGKR